MLDKNLWGKFELVQISTGREKGDIRISDNKKAMNISSKYMKQLGWEDKTRVNLYRFGETFALEKDKVGLLTIHKNGNSGAITSSNFCLEILSRTKSCKVFEGWVEDGILFFKPMKGEE